MFLLPQNTWQMRKTAKKGRGVFATKDITAGTIIGDYLGLLISVDEEDKYDDGESMYLMYYADNVTIYPDPKKPGIHILNHSCEPNCFMYTYKGHTLFFALRKIHKGEELTLSYQLHPLDDDCEPCIHACYCYTASCTGNMHMSQVKYNAWRKFDDANEAKTKSIPTPLKKHLQLLDAYPQKIADNTIYKLFGIEGKRPLVIQSAKLPTRKEIREKIKTSGRKLFFPKLGLMIRGIEGNELYIKVSH